MATASVTNTFVAATPAEAAEVNTNFTNLVTFLNNSVVHRDGSKAMSANLDVGSNKIINVTTGTSDTDAVNVAQMSGDASVMPLGVIDYAQITSGTAAVTTTVTDIAGLSITFTAVAGRRYRITGQALIARSAGTANDTINLYVRNGAGTTISLCQETVHAGSGYTSTMSVGVVTAPSAGSTTYKLSFNGSGGSQAISASATNPAWILVEDIGLA